MIFLARTTLNKDVAFLLPPSDKAWLWQSSRWSWRPQGQGSRWRACSARPAWPYCLSPRAPPKRNVNVVNFHPTNFIPTRERNDSQPSHILPLPSPSQSSQGKSCKRTWNITIILKGAFIVTTNINSFIITITTISSQMTKSWHHGSWLWTGFSFSSAVGLSTSNVTFK